MPPRHQFSPQALKAALLTRLNDLVVCLFAARRVQPMAHEYRIGSNGSLSVRREDGAFFDHESGGGGDVIGLIQYALGTDFKGALVFAHGFLGDGPTLPLPPAPDGNRKGREAEARMQRRRDRAVAIRRLRSPIRGTLAEKYLRKHRGIEIDPLPETLGFAKLIYNFTTEKYLPAMIAPMRDAHGEPAAVHVTFLDPATGDKIAGEGVRPRLIFGPCRGHAIRLAEATHRLALCEGIEDALSVMQCCPEWPVWATGGTSGLRTVEIPKTVREVLICGDRDAAGMEAARVLAGRLTREGCAVSVALPPEGVKDFNGLLRQEACHGVR